MRILSNRDLDKSLNNFLQSSMVLHPETAVCYQLMYDFGFRFIEVFEPKRWFLKEEEQYLIDTAKKSNNRLIMVDSIPLIYQLMISEGISLVPEFRYLSAARNFKKYYDFRNVKVGHKGVSLHLFRYNKARMLSMSGMSDQEVADYFGEVSLSNMQLYIDSIITAD